MDRSLMNIATMALAAAVVSPASADPVKGVADQKPGYSVVKGADSIVITGPRGRKRTKRYRSAKVTKVSVSPTRKLALVCTSKESRRPKKKGGYKEPPTLTCYVVDLRTGRQRRAVRCREFSGFPFGAWSPKGKRLLVGGENNEPYRVLSSSALPRWIRTGRARVLKLDIRKLERTPPLRKGEIRTLVFYGFDAWDDDDTLVFTAGCCDSARRYRYFIRTRKLDSLSVHHGEGSHPEYIPARLGGKGDQPGGKTPRPGRKK